MDYANYFITILGSIIDMDSSLVTFCGIAFKDS